MLFDVLATNYNTRKPEKRQGNILRITLVVYWGNRLYHATHLLFLIRVGEIVSRSDVDPDELVECVQGPAACRDVQPAVVVDAEGVGPGHVQVSVK